MGEEFTNDQADETSKKDLAFFHHSENIDII